jgi:sulfide:quinone oxidoreductase
MSTSTHHQILIIGGGAAGISVAARLMRQKGKKLDIAIVEPSDKHYYQPFWTFAGAGVVKKQASERTEASVMPRGVSWIRDAAMEFLPEQNALKTRDGRTLTYDWLIVALGMQLNWDKVIGLKDAVGKDGVCSNYSYATVDSTWESIQAFKGGTAIFTHPPGAVKCGGAPQKIMYLADERFRAAGVRDKTKIVFVSALGSIYHVDKYRPALEKVVARKGIECKFTHELKEVRAASKEVLLVNSATKEETVMQYDLLHVTPPMGPPACIAQSPLANPDGFIDVDKGTTRHVKFPNVFSLGDCASLPTSKTAAAIRKQAPICAANLAAAMQGVQLPQVYDGYTSCPLITGFGKLVLAEFNYDKVPTESFPFDQSKERYSMWLLKRYLLPWIYWNGMLKGRM